MKKLASYISDLTKSLNVNKQPNTKSRSFDTSGLGSVSGSIAIDMEKAYKIICTMESNCNYTIGDSGTSFGTTQVQFGSFVAGLANDPNVEELTGISKSELLELNKSWRDNVVKSKQINLWEKEPINKDIVSDFVKRNPNSVVKRREGTTVKYNPTNLEIVKFEKNGTHLYRLSLNALKSIGLDTTLAMPQLQKAIESYVTNGVVRNAIVKSLTQQANENTYAKFSKIFSKQNVQKNQNIRNLADRVTQKDFTNRVNSVVNSVIKSGYDVNNPDSYNIYQLIAISNVAGIGAVDKFLLKKVPFSAAQTHYLQRANSIISRIAGIKSDFPPQNGMAGFGFKNIASIKTAANNNVLELARLIVKAVNSFVKNEKIDYKKYKIVNIVDHNNKIFVVVNNDNVGLINSLIPASVDGKDIVVTNKNINESVSVSEPTLPKVSNLKLSKRTNILQFPQKYLNKIKNGTKTLSLRKGELPFEENQMVECHTYSGDKICDIKILFKNSADLNAIKEKFGEKVFNKLKEKFGENSVFTIIKFKLCAENLSDDYNNSNYSLKGI